MMQVYELEYQKKHEAKTKGVALAVNNNESKTEEIENQVDMIVKKIFKKMELGQCKGSGYQQKGYEKSSKS